MRNLSRIVMAAAVGAMAAFSGMVAQPLVASAAGTWTAQNPGINTEFPGIFPVDKNQAWLIGGEAGDALNTEATSTILNVVRHTTDGGATWLNDAKAQAAERLSGGHELKKAFFVGNDGWIIGEQADSNEGCSSPSPAPGPSGAPDWNIILHTTDGGATWTRLASPGTGGFDHCQDLEAVYATSATDAWITVGSIGTKSDGSQNGIFHWDGTKLKFVSFGAGSCNARDGVSFPPKAGSTSRAEGWVVDGLFNSQTGHEEACIMHTANGGLTWTQQSVIGCSSVALPNPQSNCGNGEDISCLDTQHCWASQDTFSDNLGAAVDVWNGTSWTAHSVDAAGTAGCHQSDFDGVAFLDPTHGFAVGEHRCLTPGNITPPDAPEMWSSSNGGVSWAHVTLPSGHGPLVAIRFADPCNGWAVGERGAVFHYTDPTGCLVATSAAPASTTPKLPAAGATGEGGSPVPILWILILSLAALGIPVAARARHRSV